MASSRLCYIDGLSMAKSSFAGVVPLGRLSLEELDKCLTTAIQHLSTQGSANKIVIILDGLDFLLACQPSSTSIDSHRMLLELQTRVHGVIVTCAADSPLLHSTDASATPLELEHTTLARGLARQARWLFQLRPLETGQSREVSGSVRMNKGGAWEDTENVNDLGEGEWLFHFRNDGVVKVWGRGEA